MSAELQGYPSAPEPRQTAARPPSPKVTQMEEAESDDENNNNSSSPFTSLDEQELYQGALAEALESDEIEEIVPETSSTVLPKVNTNYESMTLAELKVLAKQRGITGSSSMKRSQILDALKPKAPPADGGILSALAEQGSPVESN